MAEHAVLVYLRLSDDEFGESEKRDAIHNLCDELKEAIEEDNSGEFDGDEFGEGQCTLFMYGPDADKLFATNEPLLRASPFTTGGYAIKRYGEATDSNAKEARVEL